MRAAVLFVFGEHGTFTEPSGDALGATSSIPFRIVINYRREDTAGHAGRLYDALAERFGHDRVFMDIDAIEPGVDFTKVIEEAVASCDAFIALIGRDWLTVTDARGRRRLDAPSDFVRLEIEAALGREVRFIPVLVQDAEMPTTDDLPGSIASLAFRNAVEIRDTSWRSDVDRLIRTLARLEREKGGMLGEGGDGDDVPDGADTPPGPGVPRRTLLAVAGTVLLLALGGLLAALLLRDGEDDAPTTLADTPVDTAGGRIVYSVPQGGIYAVDPDAQTRTPEPLRETGGAPDWSPDGKRIAFADGNRIGIMSSDGEVEDWVTDGSDDHAPAWSTDGVIAFDRKETGEVHVYVVAADGGAKPDNLTDGGQVLGGGAPDWSPDGTRIVYQRKFRLFAMNADGTDKKEIATDAGRKLSPAWSPDGKEIAFALYPKDGGSYLCVIPANGGRCERLTPRLVNVNFPAWSSDGMRLVFTVRGSLRLVVRASKAMETILSGVTAESPAWPPRA